MDTPSDPLAALSKAPGSKEREATWVSWNWPRSETSIKAFAYPLVSVSVPQEKLPEVRSYNSLLVAAVSQSPRPLKAIPSSKEEEESTSSLPEMRRSLAPVRKEEVVSLIPNLEKALEAKPFTCSVFPARR